MKFAMLLSSLLIGNAIADTITYKVNDAAAAKIAKLFKGKTLVCVPSDEIGHQQDKGFYPVKISAKALTSKSTSITIKTKVEGVRFGFGGDELTDIGLTHNWLILSVVDDGRREFMVQYYAEFAKDNACDGKDYDGDIAGINSVIWNAGSIGSHGIKCCFEK